jgi:hypothetical protein
MPLPCKSYVALTNWPAILHLSLALHRFVAGMLRIWKTETPRGVLHVEELKQFSEEHSVLNMVGRV